MADKSMRRRIHFTPSLFHPAASPLQPLVSMGTVSATDAPPAVESDHSDTLHLPASLQI